MTSKRLCYEPGHKPKCLVIVDDTAEWDRAVYYACLLYTSDAADE